MKKTVLVCIGILSFSVPAVARDKALNFEDLSSNEFTKPMRVSVSTRMNGKAPMIEVFYFSPAPMHVVVEMSNQGKNSVRYIFDKANEYHPVPGADGRYVKYDRGEVKSEIAEIMRKAGIQSEDTESHKNGVTVDKRYLDGYLSYFHLMSPKYSMEIKYYDIVYGQHKYSDGRLYRNIHAEEPQDIVNDMIDSMLKNLP